MSSDFYFKKLKTTLSKLEKTLELDLAYQNSKAHDKKRCDAVLRLNSILGQYIVIYNESLGCLHQNLQMQKTKYIVEIVKAITNRIIELKHQVTKLECSNVQFLGNGLAQCKLTTNNVEFVDIPSHPQRKEFVSNLVSDAFQKAEEKREELLRKAKEEVQKKLEDNLVKHWWEYDEHFNNHSDTENIEPQRKDSEESAKKKKMIALIQSHERSRQITQRFNRQKQRRLMWEKELAGKLKPQPRFDLKERSAKIIQKVLRAYFEIKRNKKLQCQENELLDIKMCVKYNTEDNIREGKIKINRIQQKKQFEQEWVNHCDNLRRKYSTQIEELKEYYRDYIRNWFRKWFDDVQYFHEIPKDKNGGSVLIIKEELPEPNEWWEEYQQYLIEKKANKNMSSIQRTWAEKEAKNEEILRKKEVIMKKKLKANLLKKLMKNPNLHPGFNYPKSKIVQYVLDALCNYKSNWEYLDKGENHNIKEGFVVDFDVSNVCAEIRVELLKTVDDDMRQELKMLQQALKSDYIKNGEKMPDRIKPLTRHTKKKKKKKEKKIVNKNIAVQLEDLALKNILMQYPKTTLENFMGDHNYAGDDMRCNYDKPQQFSGELRSVWWEKCQQLRRGFHKILVVGPRQSGKTVLVHALASLNNAVLFELDLDKIYEQTSSTADLQHIVSYTIDCAKATQPSVIYLRHINRLYWNKVPPFESVPKLEEIKKIIVRKLIKKFRKSDQITVVASCVDPWRTRSRKIIKLFPAVVLIPDMSYSAVMLLLNNWICDNHAVPRDLDIQSLAHMLQGYTYGYLKESLREFLSPERVVKIAAYGLSPVEVYDFILNKDLETRMHYQKYLQWYTEKTHWGKKEKQHIEQQREFHRVAEKIEEKRKKQKQPLAVSSVNTRAIHSERWK